jgi:thiol:disulfide interchange protein
MNRRDFLLTVTAVTLALPIAARAAATYTPDLLAAELAAGKTVFLTFKASWCSTCAAQERVIGALRAENPAYAAISFIDVDWDKWGKGDLVRQLNIPRRSTLVVLKGDQELGRIVAGTQKAEIQALMDLALQSAQA